MYAKLENGRLTRAPRMLDIGENHVYNPTEEQLAAEGYKPVLAADRPDAPEGFWYEAGWTETEEAIVRSWTLRELPPEEASEEDYAEALGRLGVSL